MSVRAYLGLGSNLGDRAAHLGRATACLEAAPGLTVVARSPVYETDPWGYADQAAFLNAALSVDTDLSPEALLALALDVESRLGRRRGGRRWGPRVVDVDLLLYGEMRRAHPDPVLPHPRLHERSFALRPLLDLDAGLVVPGHGPVADLLGAIGDPSRRHGVIGG